MMNIYDRINYTPPQIPVKRDCDICGKQIIDIVDNLFLLPDGGVSHKRCARETAKVLASEIDELDDNDRIFLIKVLEEDLFK